MFLSLCGSRFHNAHGRLFVDFVFIILLPPSLAGLSALEPAAPPTLHPVETASLSWTHTDRLKEGNGGTLLSSTHDCCMTPGLSGFPFGHG